MTSRFELLKTQYLTDILRLENISEAGTLFHALEFSHCPFCGSESASNSEHSICAGNISDLIPAAKAEKLKIQVLLKELISTIEQLKSESNSIQKMIPKIEKNWLRPIKRLRC